jgi:hypothetical protein
VDNAKRGLEDRMADVDVRQHSEEKVTPVVEPV